MTTRTTESEIAKLFDAPNKELGGLLDTYHSDKRYILGLIDALNKTAEKYNTLRALIPSSLLNAKCVDHERLTSVWLADED